MQQGHLPVAALGAITTGPESARELGGIMRWARGLLSALARRGELLLFPAQRAGGEWSCLAPGTERLPEVARPMESFSV